MINGVDRSARAVTHIWTAPNREAALDDQLLFGQPFKTLGTQGDYLKIKPLDAISGRGGNAGYILAENFKSDVATISHRVSFLCAPVFSRADIKSPIRMQLSFGSLIEVVAKSGDFFEMRQGFIHKKHLSAVMQTPPNIIGNIIKAAQKFEGLPYYWGGRSHHGVDCSGLVQNAFWSVGLACPRNSSEQAEFLGTASSLFGQRQPGELIFWPGHVGIMLDELTLLHANAYHMAVTQEPLKDAQARIARTYGPIVAVRQLTAQVKQA